MVKCVYYKFNMFLNFKECDIDRPTILLAGFHFK